MIDFPLQIDRTIEQYSLFNYDDKLLLACSGGIDSMFLAHYLLFKKYEFGIAHIDHSTRDGQSTKDAVFVSEFCEQYKIPFHLLKIDIIAKSKNSKESFQSFAREIRYDFFHKITIEEKYTKVLLGHHLNDSIETFFINLSRSSGINGLSGIPISRDNIVRPLIEISKKLIIQYARVNNIVYKQDSTNFSNDYKRNYFRNEIFPILEKWDPKIEIAIHKSMNNLLEADLFLKDSIQQWEQKIIKKTPDYISIKLLELNKSKNKVFILYKILAKYGFNKDQVIEIFETDQKGKKWKTANYIVYHEKKELLIAPISKIDNTKVEFSLDSTIPNVGRFEITENIPNDTLRYQPIDKKIDTNKIIIRQWMHGDYMQLQIGKKKLKKLFSELNINNIEKSKLLLVAFKSEVIWIIGYKKGFVKSPSNKYLVLLDK